MLLVCTMHKCSACYRIATAIDYFALFYTIYIDHIFWKTEKATWFFSPSNSPNDVEMEWIQLYNQPMNRQGNKLMHAACMNSLIVLLFFLKSCFAFVFCAKIFWFCVRIRRWTLCNNSNRNIFSYRNQQLPLMFYPLRIAPQKFDEI